MGWERINQQLVIMQLSAMHFEEASEASDTWQLLHLMEEISWYFQHIWKDDGGSPKSIGSIH